VSFRAGVHRDAGMVPLSLQVTAKGENKTTQLAALRQVSSCFQRSHPRAKRKPDPRIKALQPGSSPLGCGRDCARAGRIAGVMQLFQMKSPVGEEKADPGSRHSSLEAHRWDVAEIALARGASLRDAADVCSLRGCGKIYDSHLTCMEKPCIMIDKELLLFKCYILVKLINICYTHKEKRQWQKLEL